MMPDTTMSFQVPGLTKVHAYPYEQAVHFEFENEAMENQARRIRSKANFLAYNYFLRDDRRVQEGFSDGVRIKLQGVEGAPLKNVKEAIQHFALILFSEDCKEKHIPVIYHEDSTNLK